MCSCMVSEVPTMSVMSEMPGLCVCVCSCMVSEVPTVSVVFNYKVPGVPTMSGVPKVSMVGPVTYL